MKGVRNIHVHELVCKCTRDKKGGIFRQNKISLLSGVQFTNAVWLTECPNICLFSLTLCQQYFSHIGGQLTYTHCSWADLDLLSGLPVLIAHTFASNWQLPFLNQQQEENNHRNYFMINLHESNMAGLGLKLMTPGLAVKLVANCTMEPSMSICILLGMKRMKCENFPAHY